MALLFQNLLPLIEDSERGNVRIWWLAVAAIVFMALCWFALSVMKKGGRGSLWKDKDSEMDSGRIPIRFRRPESHASFP